MKTFVLLDESLNEFGFWIPLAGLDVEQFKKNPIMLWMHNRAFYGKKDEVLPIGRWENIRVEDGKLLADAIFDENDKFAAAIGDKVENDFLKMASVGVRILGLSSETKDLKPGQTRETPVKTKLREASIVDIGGLDNSLALAFYDEEDKLINLSDKGENIPVKLLSNENNQSNTDMTEIKKTAGLLQLTDKASDEELSAKVQEILTAKTTAEAESVRLKGEIAALVEKEKNANKAEAAALVDEAVKDGRIDAAGKDSMLKLFESDHASAKATLAAIPKRTSIQKELKDGEGKAKTELEGLLKLSWDELDKGNKLETLKSLDIDAFKAKYQDKFKAEYK